ncbi:serine/threonine protein kinase [Thalassoroseus pseudoceratinae]|uniref:serine/threonine protein kinase n=1 Tax=Thalassoroseus pseudoceratinae TaxID=2713176 RepID=UPI0014239235|nr:serine/threonine-protein kinase [Thalassoroseus pseudoceratinae]
MTLKLTAASFLACLKRSELIESKLLERLLATFRKQGVNLDDAKSLSQALIQADALTEWQASKLQQGRYKGFFLGRYRLLRLLSTGETSAVYLAQHLFMNRKCAIKVLPGHRVKDTSYLGRFYREAEAVASLDHQNIVRAYDIGCQDDSGTELHYLVLQYVEGQTLEQSVQESGPLPLTLIVDLIRQAAEGLAHAHSSGLIHRDIKPANLLITPDKTLKLVDLGLARFFKATEEESLTVKHDEKVLGTADYLAPEQAVDSHQVDERADVYALGCTLYFALTGHPPFNDGTLVQRLLAHQTRQPPSVKRDRPDTPDEILEVLDRMMAKKPGDRYQTAQDVADALSSWLVSHADSAWRKRNWNLVLDNRPAESPGSKLKPTPKQITQPAAKALPQNSSTTNKPTAKKPSNRKPKASSTSPRPQANAAVSRPTPVNSEAPAKAVLETPASRPIKINTETSGRQTRFPRRNWRPIFVTLGVLIATALGYWQWSIHETHSITEQANSTEISPIKPDSASSIQPLEDSEIRGGN